jgi:hypothetical protein
MVTNGPRIREPRGTILYLLKLSGAELSNKTEPQLAGKRTLSETGKQTISKFAKKTSTAFRFCFCLKESQNLTRS